MFNRLILLLAGSVRIKVEGLNLDRLLTALLNGGFVLYGLKRPSYQVLTFSVSYRRKKRVCAFLQKQSYKFSVTDEKGLPAGLKKLSLRIGLIAGFILCVSGAAAYSGRVWDIRVEGLERIKASEVTAILTEMGYRGGMRKKDVDRGEVALALNIGLADAADVTAEMRGTCLIIRINETTEKDGGTTAAPHDITASYDAVVTRVLALDGTALVKPGDIVRKGAVLIAGYNLDKEGNRTEVAAKGEVRGKVFFSAENVFFTEREEYVRTGSFIENRGFKICGMSLKIKNTECPYALYDSETVTGVIFKSFLPLYNTAERFYELEAKTVHYDYEAVKDALISRLRQEAEAKVPKGAYIAGVKTDVRQIDKYIVTMYNIETEMLL